MEPVRRPLATLLPPGLMALALLAAGAAPLPREDPPASEVRVARALPITSAQVLFADLELALLAFEVDAYEDAHPGPIDPTDLARVLDEGHDLVWRDPPQDFEYLWVIDEEGQVIRICYVPVRIHVKDGPDEFVVTVPQVMVL